MLTANHERRGQKAAIERMDDRAMPNDRACQDLVKTYRGRDVRSSDRVGYTPRALAASLGILFASPVIAQQAPTSGTDTAPSTDRQLPGSNVPYQFGAPPAAPVPAAPPIPDPVPGGRTAPPGMPQSLRWTEDWSHLADRAKKRSPLEALRYIPLGSDPKTYLSIGGEVRYNYTYWSALTLGAQPNDKLSALQQRLRLVGDLHLGTNIRAFVELGDNREYFEDFATPPNRDKMDITQAFVDISIPISDTSKLTLSPGRFEMPIGNGKLVGLRDGVNVRYIYQGFRATYIEAGKLRIDSWAVKPVTFDPGTFDDGPEKTRHFNGVYAGTVPGLLVPNVAVDVYWYDLYRENARYATRVGTESRRSWGMRLSGRAHGFDYDAEGTYQNGSFAGQRISAWGTLLEGGYSLPNAPMKPRIGVRANYFSGDTDSTDGKIGTFAPPFPRTPLYSDAGWLNFSNLIDVFPSLTVRPDKKLVLVVGPDFFWRATKGDAVYAGPTNFPLIRPVGDQKYVGTNLNLQGDYIATKNLTFRLFYTHFMASDSFREGGGKGSDYFGFWTDFRF